MKQQLRILGVDDGPFTFDMEDTPLVGVLMRQGYIDAVFVSRVGVDGDDATARLVEIVNGPYREQIKAVMIDGIAFGGFNVVDIEEVHRQTGVPVITVTRSAPDVPAMKEALRHHFREWEPRWRVIERNLPSPVESGGYTLHIRAVGTDLQEAVRLIDLSRVRGALPEPLRVAHLIATAVARGHSHGL